MTQFFRSSFFVLFLLASGFLFFPPWLVVFEMLMGGGVWWFLQQHSSEKNQLSGVGWNTLWWVALILLVVSRLFPFFISDTPFGYDTGIYRYELLESFRALPEYVSQVFLGVPLLTNVFQLFGVSIDTIVGFFYAGIVLLLPLSLALVAEKMWGRKVAVFVLLLFLLSTVQWKAFGMILFKQEFALALGFFLVWLFSRRSWLVLICFPFLALLQPLEAFLLGLAVLIYGVFSSFRSTDDRKYFGVLLSASLLFFLCFLWLDPDFWQRAWEIFYQGIFQPASLETSLQSGIFLSLADYGYQAVFFFVFGILGICFDWKNPRSFLLRLYWGAILLWIAFGLFFYERMLISFDTFFILFSAITVSRLVEIVASDRWGKVLSILLLIGLSLPFLLVIARFQPLIAPEELLSIQSFCGQLPAQTYVAATDSFYGPWLKGYCPDQRVFAPGLFPDNRWSRSEWESFWEGDSTKIPELLKRYESAPYFYRGERQFQLEFDPLLFEWVEGGWWRGKGTYGM